MMGLNETKNSWFGNKSKLFIMESFLNKFLTSEKINIFVHFLLPCANRGGHHLTNNHDINPYYTHPLVQWWLESHAL